MVIIDGRTGEGGGQVLRTSLALSMITGEPVVLEHIRAKRDKPGLMRQHLTCVKAAAEVSGAEVTGAKVRSSRVEFSPGAVTPGAYHFAVGTAGSAPLVLQTVLPALMNAGAASQLTLEGGTHNPKAPSYHFLERVFAPVLARTGPMVHLKLESAGFYPAGGGTFTATIEPVAREDMTHLELTEAGEDLGRKVYACSANLPKHIAEREIREISDTMAWPDEVFTCERWEGPGPGNVLWIEVMHEHVTEMVTRLGTRGRPAEQIARDALEELRAYLATGAPVGEHLADQLLLPMALAGGGVFECTPPSLHTRTQAEIIEKFLEVEFVFTQVDEDRRRWRVEVEV